MIRWKKRDKKDYSGDVWQQSSEMKDGHEKMRWNLRFRNEKRKSESPDMKRDVTTKDFHPYLKSAIMMEKLAFSSCRILVLDFWGLALNGYSNKWHEPLKHLARKWRSLTCKWVTEDSMLIQITRERKFTLKFWAPGALSVFLNTALSQMI